jgi:hypothetical protein
MRNAFINAKVKTAIIGSKVVNSVLHALDTNAGVQKVGRGWTANVSRRTLVQLQKEGVFA